MSRDTLRKEDTRLASRAQRTISPFGSLLHRGVGRLGWRIDSRRLGHHHAESTEKCGGPSIVRKFSERAQNVCFAHRQAGADGVWIDTDAFELLK